MCLFSSTIFAQSSQATFEVATVKPVSLVARDGKSSNPDNPGGCSGIPQMNSNRLAIPNASVYNLILLAYGMNCFLARSADLVSGVPEWARSERFDIQAVIPANSAMYSVEQLRNGNAPTLQRMLQALLADRFKLALRRETKEMSVYLLTTTKGGPKLATSREEDRPALVTTRRTDPNGNVSSILVVRKSSMATLVEILPNILRRPVLDRTGLDGEVNFDVVFAREDRSDETGASLFTALQEQVGLKLEAAKAPVEVLIIDHVERPSEN